MQVRIRPSHRILDVVIQHVEATILNLDTPPDGGLDAQEGDLELVDLFGVGGLMRSLPPRLPLFFFPLPDVEARAGCGSGSLTHAQTVWIPILRLTT